MKKQIPENFIGYLDLQGRGNGEYDCFFSVDGYKVSVIPKGKDLKAYISNIFNARCSSIALNRWVFAEIPLGGKVAFYAHELFATGFIPQDGTLYFYASIMLRGDSSAIMSTFEKVEFFGGIVDILYPPSKAEARTSSFGETGIKPYDEYTKNFAVCLNDENINVCLSIVIIESPSSNRLTDRSKSYSTLSFSFSSPKPLNVLSEYYSYAKSIFSFLTFTRNVSFGTSVFTSPEELLTASGERIAPRYVTVETKINDSFIDYSNDTIDSWTKILDVEKLIPNISQLFEVLYFEYLLFLPKQNKDQSIIYHHNIVDLSSCLEREYKKLGNRLPSIDENIVADAKSLHNDIKKFIKDTSYDDKAKEKALALINNLKSFQPSAKEKIMAIYTKFYSVMNFVANIDRNFPNGSFESEIGKFIKLRNDIAHDKEIILEGNVSIYRHLILLVYVSVLHRANFDDEAIKSILEIPFNYLRIVR